MPLVLMTAPLAPHIAEELWELTGHTETLTYEPFPEADPALLVEDQVEIAVQVDGKVRARVMVAGRRRRRGPRGRREGRREGRGAARREAGAQGDRRPRPAGELHPLTSTCLAHRWSRFVHVCDAKRDQGARRR